MTAQSRVPMLLKLAILSGIQTPLRLYLDRGGDVNAADSKGQTLLILSASKGHTAICQLLIDAGADRSSVDDSGRNACAVAVAGGYHDVVSILQYVPQASEQAESDGEHAEGCISDVPLSEKLDPTDDASSDTIDLFAWEEDHIPLVPVPDPDVFANAGSLQRRISAHTPIDTSEDWSDIEIDLPELSKKGSRQARADRKAVRDLITNGVLSGGITRWRIAELALKEDGEADYEYESQLGIVLDDLGIVIEDDDYWEWYTGDSDPEIS